MEVSFTYIRNRIREHKRQDLLQACYNVLDSEEKEPKPVWFVFLLMKWTYLHGEETYPSKVLTDKQFSNILNSIFNFNQEHVSSFLKQGKIDRALHIIFSQQFYLQEGVRKEKFATQLKLFCILKSKYDIDVRFKAETGFSILDFIYLTQITWLYANSDILGKKELNFNGYLSNDFLIAVSQLTDLDKVRSFLKLLVLDPINTNEKIINFKRSVRAEELQSMERTFFTLYPFQLFNNGIRIIHKSVFNYSANYYIYDYLKSNDEGFTTEFGLRFEKYIELGIKEISYKYLNETEIKKKLPPNSTAVDFHLTEYNVFIECKAIEIQPYPSINPTDDLLYNSLKDSILKAYFKQLLPVSKKLNGSDENWGIILTYKKLFWSHFVDLYDLGKDKFDSLENNHLPPENVFITDIYTWDKVVQIIKNGQATILDILKLAKSNNSVGSTKKQSFDMHLDIYDARRYNLTYLTDELEKLKIRV
jgi:hypothetical protein